MHHENRRGLWLAFLTDAAVLACALVGWVVSFLSLYASTEANPISDLIPAALRTSAAHTGAFAGAAALFAAVGAAVWHLPRLRAAAAGGLAAVWAWVVLQNGPHVLNGALPAARVLVNTVCRCMGIGWEFSYTVRYGAGQTQKDVRLSLLLFLAGLALVLGWCVARARSWWGAVLLTLPPLLPAMLLGVYPRLPALTALAAAWCALLFEGLCRRGAPAARARLAGTALLASALLLTGMLAALPREGYTRPPWALALNDHLMDFYRTFASSGGQTAPPAPTGTVRTGSAGQADLSHAGPLHFSGRTVLRVRSEYDGRLYLRGASLAVYERGVWKPLPENAYADLAQPLNEERAAVSPLVLAAAYGSPEEVYSAVIENIGAGGERAYIPYYPTVQNWDEAGARPIDDAYFARQGLGRTHTVEFARLADDALQTGYVTSHLTGDDGYYSFVQKHYLALSDEILDALWEIPGVAELIGSYLSTDYRPRNWPVQCARGVANYLSRHCAYDPRADAAPAGTDPVFYFLTTSHRGYCMHFASAAVLLLRAAGVPARYVSGYVAECVPGERVSVPDRAAHAWVEVWTDSLGWYPVEVTPAAAMTVYAQGMDALESGSRSGDADAASSGPQSGSEDTSSSSGTGEAAQTGGMDPADLAALRAVGRALLWAAGLSALAWAGQAVPKCYRARRLADRDRNRAVIYAYRCLCRLERWGGAAVSEPVAELAGKARFSAHTLTNAEAAAVLEALAAERTRLGRTLPSVWRAVFWYVWGWPSARPQAGKHAR